MKLAVTLIEFFGWGPMDNPTLSPFAAFLGISIDEFSEGRVLCSINFCDHHVNNGGESTVESSLHLLIQPQGRQLEL